MLENFDIAVLEDPEYKEDAVREDIIAPCLKKLGYSSSSQYKIVRSRSLSHPYVNIGSKQNKINIVPDYILEINNSAQVIIDAKSPHVSLEKSKHSEQAYSYAIHPEIRAKMYSLCNGKEWIIWDIDKFDPILKITITDLKNNFSKIEKILKPQNVLDPNKREYFRDYGLSFFKMGINDTMTQYFICNEINFIGKTEDNLYTLNVLLDVGDENLMVTFDMNKKHCTELINMFPAETQSFILEALAKQPYYAFGFEPILVTIAGKFGTLQHGVDEDFVPIVIENITKFELNS